MGLGGEHPASTGIQRDRKLKLSDVAAHNNPKSAWLIVRNKVYDISGYNHPGGNVIYSHAGSDATDIFAAFHPPSAHRVLESMCIGTLDDASIAIKEQTGAHRAAVVGSEATKDKGMHKTSMAEVERDFRALRAAAKRMGLFEASSLYYVWKVASTLGLLACGVALMALMPGTWIGTVLGASFVALFWQQSGWLSHDFIHHQVFPNRYHGDLMGVFLGNVCQGFSLAWWKNKHNTHHAVPNLHESEPERHDGDPDIDTMPLLAWSATMAQRYLNRSGVARFCVRHQTILYFPILLLARLSWLYQSYCYAFHEDQGAWGDFNTKDGLLKKMVPHKPLERAGLVVYYLWNLTLMFLFMTPAQALAYFFISQMLCGILLAIPFGVGHNGMTVFDAGTQPDFYRFQILTTRNVIGHWIVGWFMGGLHHQVEHHLFPTMPRHNLGRMSAMVRRTCEKHNIPYHATSLWEGTVEVIRHLKEVSVDAFHNFPAM